MHEWEEQLARVKSAYVTREVNLKSVSGQGNEGDEESRSHFIAEDSDLNLLYVKAFPKEMALSNQQNFTTTMVEGDTMMQAGSHPFIVEFGLALQTKSYVLVGTRLYPGGDLEHYTRNRAKTSDSKCLEPDRDEAAFLGHLLEKVVR